MIELNFSGIVVGVCSFLIIGLFHPLVIKAEYYFGVRFWWVFLIMGLLGLAGSLFVTHQILSVLLGVFAFSSFWGILVTGNTLIQEGDRVVVFCLEGMIKSIERFFN
jgi:hypothetical protein